MQFLCTIRQSLPVRRINNPYNPIRLFEIILPIRAQRPLSSYIPLHQPNPEDAIHIFNLYFSKSIVDILNPSVGLISLNADVCASASGSSNLATMVDFPAASRPRNNNLSCLSFNLCFFNVVYNPIPKMSFLLSFWEMVDEKEMEDGMSAIYRHGNFP